MADTFVPPPVSSWQGPDQAPPARSASNSGGFVPPPVSSWEGPSGSTDSGGSHILDSLGNGISNFWDKINPITAVQGVNAAVQNPRATAKAMGAQNLDIWKKATDAWDKGNHVEAARHAINYTLNGIPGLGAQIEDAQDKQAAGDYSGAAGSSLGIGAGLALPEHVPPALRAAGRVVKKTAVPLAETALGITKMARAYSKTPGVAALEETKGFNPAAVATSARSKVGALDKELTGNAAVATRQGVQGTLAPARQGLADRAAIAASGNSSYTPEEMALMQKQLTVPQPGFGGATSYPPGAATKVQITPTGVIRGAIPPLVIDELQSPSTILRMKREFGNDFTKWSPLHPNKDMGVARQAYRALDQELDRTVPGADQLNQRISSLIPVAERGEDAALNAGWVQRSLHRIGAHSGAGLGLVTGYHYGGPLGAVAGLVGPELLSSPTARMAAARGMYGGGKALATPVVGQIGRAAGHTGAAGIRNPYRDDQ